MDSMDGNGRLEELHALESNLQNFLMQKQAAQIELNEISNALGEIEKSEEIYKMISGVMLKTTKKEMKKELDDKKRVIEMKISSMEKQEKLLEKDALALRKEISAGLAGKK